MKFDGFSEISINSNNSIQEVYIMKLMETVPNFSEGRRVEVVEEIVNIVNGFDDVWKLDHSMDKDHNRSVVTLVGKPETLMLCLFEMVKKASELIDLRVHKGEHPRMGATDVIPLVPIKDVDMKDCISYSKHLAKRIGDELHIPVYLYEMSATQQNRKNLSNIRRGEFEGFFEKIKLPEWEPDYGPKMVHPTAGVSAVGAREFLIAYNVNLATSDIEIANKIARAVRHINGGFRYVKAMGVELKERGIVQVSMNLTNFKKTPIFRVFEVIKRESARYGVNIIGSELIGLIPQKALVDVADFYLQMENLEPSKIIENKIMEVMEE